MPGVVVEGPDGAGKTTLIRRIRNEFHWPIIHVVQPGDPNLAQMVKLVECEPVVFDRFHLSPVAYGEALRDGPELDWHDTWALEGLLVARGFVLIVCLTDLDAMIANNRREEQLWEATRLKAPMELLSSIYVRIGTTTQLPVRRYDYGVNSVDETFDFVKQNIRPSAPAGVIGTSKPDVWLVGDERNGNVVGYPWYNMPFYWPRGGHMLTSATLVGKAMAEIGLTWGNTALSNSERGPGVLSKWYEGLNEPTVIAMGGKATARLREAGIEHRSVQHPQYVKRFHYRQAVELMTEQLRGAIG